MDLRKELTQLASVSNQLSTSSSERASQLESVQSHAEAFLGRLPELAVYNPAPPRHESLKALEISSKSTNLQDTLTLLGQYVDDYGVNLGSSRFFSYIPSGSLSEAALGDYLAAITNRYAGVGYAAPGASRMEEVLLNWLAKLVGYPEHSTGDFTSGGSMATLSAIVTARESHNIDPAAIKRHVVYATAQAHHSFFKALRITGMGHCVVREITTDHNHRMDTDDLERQITSDIASGLAPWLVAATAGTTNSGAIDPLYEIGRIAEDNKIWYHVDAAYGGAFLLCDEGKSRLQGVERADSLILDPHKGFFMPCGLGVVLVKNRDHMLDAFQDRGVYMQDIPTDDDRSACDVSPELTRPARALKLWLSFKLHGTDVFAAALEEKLLLASYFYEQVQIIPHARVSDAPNLSIVPFWFEPPHEDSEQFTKRVLDRIVKSGRVHMTSTQLDGRFTIRMAILNYQSHIEDVDIALQILSDAVGEELKKR